MKNALNCTPAFPSDRSDMSPSQSNQRAGSDESVDADESDADESDADESVHNDSNSQRADN
ncbi:hypothetical protein N7471_007767 [Penicillium samsonianum]|uniref:uncharacterized protein n=1 Tax=Penicillium samsonianum TaxID=1882272 RepID=UPI002549428A|nr:uncharacterized protein N7471_007767 [Penicillium samsonianum]KAJ6132552.1 hypothetical protein N7471_007767 [Penicillium samsonianum]